MNMTPGDIWACEASGYPPGEIPNIVGYCQACGTAMFDYEVAECESCGKTVHRGCEVECVECHADGCKSCIDKDKDTGEYICNPECKEDFDADI